MSVDTSQRRPRADAVHTKDGNPFAAVDLYLIADFGPGEYERGFKKHHFDVVEDLERLVGGRVWIMAKGILERHVAGGAEWARHEKDSRILLRKWLMTSWMVTTHRKGISSLTGSESHRRRHGSCWDTCARLLRTSIALVDRWTARWKLTRHT